MKYINTFRKWYCLILQSAIGIILFVLACSQVYQVVTRYFVDRVVLWVEDVTVFSLYWIAALGLGWLWCTHQMLNMDVADYVLPKKVLHILDYCLEVFGLFAGPFFAYLMYTSYNANKGFILSVISVDEKYRYFPYICGGILIFISSVLRLIELIEKDRHPGREEAQNA